MVLAQEGFLYAGQDQPGQPEQAGARIDRDVPVHGHGGHPRPGESQGQAAIVSVRPPGWGRLGSANFSQLAMVIPASQAVSGF